MMRLALTLPFWLALDACSQDETIRAYGAGEGTWQLAELNGAPFAHTATLAFTKRAQIGGQAPCNSYSARMDIPFPWWGTGPIAAGQSICPDLDAESAFFAALEAARLSMVEDGQLILSAEDRTVLLVFTPAD